MSDLWAQIEDRQRLAELGLRELGPRARTYAEAEKAYRIALADRILQLKAEGMPATLLGDLARGDREVARLKVARDCAEALYKAADHAINVYKLEARLLDNQLAREWGQAERG